MEQQTAVTRTSLPDPFDDVHTNAEVKSFRQNKTTIQYIFHRLQKIRYIIVLYLLIFVWIYHVVYHIIYLIIMIVRFVLIIFRIHIDSSSF